MMKAEQCGQTMDAGSPAFAHLLRQDNRDLAFIVLIFQVAKTRPNLRRVAGMRSSSPLSLTRCMLVTFEKSMEYPRLNHIGMLFEL